MSESEKKEVTVALAGQPNVGKSSVFNLLTGLNQHVGNWPGKTVEQRTGTCVYNNTRIHLVDLPGTYSLTANSPEEVIAREYIIREKPDVVVALLSAPTLERNLYLVAELLHLEAPVIVGLNMMDVAEDEGVHIEPKVLQAALGIPVVPMIATKGQGVRELVQTIDDMIHGRVAYNPRRPQVRRDHQEVLDALMVHIADYVPDQYPKQWVALKLLEGDAEVTEMMKRQLPREVWEQVHEVLQAHEDAALAVASGRYEWVARMIRAAVVRPRAGQITLTSRLDTIATHPFWGLVALAGMLGSVFWLTYRIGVPLQGALDLYLIHGLADWLTRTLASAPAWLMSLLVEGVLGGVGTVITFLPILVIFFATMGLLEDVGYMARAAYVMDRFMHLMGLHGKSFLPLFLGFGCNVSSVVGSRVIESPSARLLTILISPLVPCTGRMAVLTFITPIFFGRSAAIVSWSVVAINLLVLALLGIILSKTLFRGERVAFIMELPLYHVPNLRTIGLLVWQRTVEFLQKAGSIILVVSVILWILSVLPHGDIETSFLAGLGRLLAPVGQLMGLDWRMMLALLASFGAKENSIATLGVLFGAAKEAVGLGEILRQSLAPASAFAFLVMQMLFIPCVATVAVMRQETNSWKWTLAGIGLLLLISLLGGIIAYQIASLF